MNHAVYGGIIGDMVGSIYEYTSAIKLKDKVYEFPFWTGTAKLPFFKSEEQRRGSKFTDDTVTGLAVAKALMEITDFSNDEMVKSTFAANMRELCPKYEWTGFGSRFWIWLTAYKGNLNFEPYQSYGNGSAMRVFPIGFAFDSLEETRRIARLSAVITHDHEEGIRGAEATASVMYLARTGKAKEEIRQYIIDEFSDPFLYRLEKTCDEIRPKYHFDVTCQGTVPEAIQCFLEGNSYEECVRLSVSLGGDADTIGCITGAMAACVYPISNKDLKQARQRLTPELLRIAEKFSDFIQSKQRSE